MGYAIVNGPGPDGRYTLSLDFGESQRQALIAALNEALARVDEKIPAAQSKVNQAEAAKAAQLVKVQQAFEELQAAMNNLPPGSPVPDTSVYTEELKTYRTLEQKLAPFETALKSLERSKKNVQLKIIEYTNLVVTEERQAWCCDFTENAPIGLALATVDIPGDPNLVLLAPGGRFWAGSDGVEKERALCSPEQAYFNAAIFPGWQKYKPTYRWGTITALDRDTGLATVSLPDTRSSANRLPIDQESVLTDVPFQYMTCGHQAFDVDDNVVIQFTGYLWNVRTIIGFLDNPKPCPLTFVGGGPFNGAGCQLQVGIPMDCQEVWSTAGELFAGFDESIKNCWSGGKKPYTFEFIDGDAPPGVSIDQETGFIIGTPSAMFSTRTLRIRAYDALYEAGVNERFADSSAIEFSSGQVAFPSTATSGNISWLSDGTALPFDWHTRNSSPLWNSLFPTLADSILYSRFEMHATAVGAGARSDQVSNSSDQNLLIEYGGVDIFSEGSLCVYVTADPTANPYLTECSLQIGYSTNSITDPHGVLGSALLSVFNPPWLT
jgi:hypothetical protein